MGREELARTACLLRTSRCSTRLLRASRCSTCPLRASRCSTRMLCASYCSKGLTFLFIQLLKQCYEMEATVPRGGPCQLRIVTCHLPPQRLNHELLQLLTFNTP